MESWSYGSELGKGFTLTDEMVSPADTLVGTTKVLTGWELKTPSSYDTSLLSTINNRGLVGLSFSENARKSVPSSSSFMGNDESASSVIDSSGRGDSSLIDLKLGRLADYRDNRSDKPLRDSRVLPPMVSSVPTKRGRSGSLGSQIPYCQVHGCNTDLSSSKDYHKRHKVCEVHSKTAKVIVNGLEQRFCQQCSRFHLLAEFDDGKRSCRKRLAGHNERRRKPQIDGHLGKGGKMLATYHGSRLLGTSMAARTSFIFPDIFPSGLLHEVKYDSTNFYRHIKVEDETVFGNQCAISFTHPYATEKQFSSQNASFSIFNNNNRYAHYSAGQQPFSRSQLQKTALEGDGLPGFDFTASIQGLNGVSDTSCALSLLSSQSQDSCSHSPGIPIGRQIFTQSGSGPAQGLAQYNMGQFSNKILQGSSQGSTSVASNKFSSSGMNSMEEDHLGTLLVSDASNAVDFDAQADGMFQGVDYISVKDNLSHGQHGPSVNLLPLSHQFRSAEHHNSSVHVKQENEAFLASTSSMWL